MNKATELKLLKEQLKQMTEKVQAFEKSLQTDIWDGQFFGFENRPHGTFVTKIPVNPYEPTKELGLAFTTEANCQAWIDYQKACVVLRDACKPYLTEEYKDAYAPIITSSGYCSSDGDVELHSKYLWVEGSEKALEIAEQCKAELLIIQNFKWEI